ncbi:MAG: APC family permease [Litorimonas sp.]
MPAPTQTPPPTRLTRQLGVPSATLLGLGSILGTGIFVSIGLAAELTGPSLLAAIGLAALLATCNALSSAQLAAAHPVSGGTYEYGYRLLHPNLGFLAGWMFLCAKTASAATAAIGASAYGLALIGVSSDSIRSGLAGAIALATMALVLSGLRRSSLINTIIVLLTITALLSLCVSVFIAAPSEASDRLMPVLPETDGWRDFFTATALMFVAYTGYGRIATLGEEAREPRRTIPLAVIATLGLSAILYMVVSASALLAIGADGLASSTSNGATPLEAAAQAVGGTTLGRILAIGAVTAMLGVLLNLILGLSRVVLAMGRRGDLPNLFSKLSSAAEPTAAILLIGFSVSLLALFGSVKMAWTFSALTVLIYYAITNLAALRLPKADKLYPAWISWIGLMGCLSLTLFIPLNIWLAGFVLAIIGFALRIFFQKKK